MEIAVIGMAGRFPEAANIDEFWENLKNGTETISFFSSEELEAEGLDPVAIDDPNYVKARGVLENIEYFDAAFFSYTPAEAELMDPQTRIFYEVVWWALENAGYSPDIFPGSIGVFAGATNNRTWEGRVIISGKTDLIGRFATDGYIDRDFLSTRIAYRLNLTGPAISMKTACSSSLVAVDVACRMLLTGQCDIAAVGGVSAPSQKKTGYRYLEGMINSPDGHVRAFDALAKGVVFSDGVGAAILKRLEEALADGDNILAVILGSALNNDGARKGSYSAPSSEGHEDVIRAALRIAEVDPEDISYVETHGTGTSLGDPVEIEGLKGAFKTDKKNYCAIGSVKSNIGHLDTAAGIVSFIKTVLILHHGYIPPSLHYIAPNPKIDFENSPFYVNTQLQEWKPGDRPRRAGVSSFGVGGTNAHVILEEAPPLQPSSGSRRHQLLLLSAKSGSALNQMSTNFARFLKENPGLNLADAAYTLKLGRSPFKQRQILVASTLDEAAAALTPISETELYDPEKVFRSTTQEEIHPVFMFSGQGSQYVNMGLDLYREEPAFAEKMDRCFEIFRSLMGYDIKDVLYPLSDQSNPSDRSDINRTEIAQPVIFMVEYALASLLMEWGIKPYAMIGHSIGEYTAACLSGVLTLEDAIRVVSLRGKYMQRMAPGSMLSVPLPEKEVLPLLTPDLDLAAINAPNLCVVSGPTEAINRLADHLKEKNLQARILHTSHAFHSQSMEPMLEEFERAVAKTSLKKPGIPYISNLTGKWITVEEAADPGYWARHLRNPVRFADGLTELLKDKNALLVEVGPGRALVTFTRQHPLKKPDQETVNLVRHPQEKISDTGYLLEKIGRIWMVGQFIDWQAFYAGELRQRIPLPLYPFQRQSFWISSEVFNNISASSLDGGSQLSRKKELEHWFYLPSWKRSLLPDPGIAHRLKDEGQALNWLFFMDDCGIGAKLAQFLIQAGHNVVTAVMGSSFTRLEQDAFALVPGKDEDYVTLLNWLEKEEKLPQRVVHLWNVTAAETPGWGSTWNEAKIEQYLDIGFYSLLYLAQAIGKKNIKEEMRITVFTNRALEATGHEVLWPEKAAVLGPVNVIPQEYPNIFCSAVDIVFPPGEGERGGEEHLIRGLLDEISSTAPDAVIAYRGNYRLVQNYEAVTINQPHQEMPRLKERGVYLVTGGLGGIGLILARYLARQVKARLILTGRSVFPPRQEWDQWLNTHSAANPVSGKILKVKELETLGAEVKVFSVDVVDYPGMKEMVAQIRHQWGSIDGVIHAAGLPGGGIIQLKTREIADRVLLPKIKGGLVLDTVLKGIPLDFILLCSSVNSVLPTLGQVDYFAANAFLDAYAFYKNTAHGIFAISVNWDAWQEVGMAVEAAKDPSEKTAGTGPQPLQCPHPLYEHYETGPGGRRKYISHMSLKTTWPMQDHMTYDEKGLLPGTTYLEMARAAWEDLSGKIPVEIFDVNFLTPMIVVGDEVREVNLLLEPQGDYFQFMVESTTPTDVNFRQRHVVGKMKALEKESPGRCNLEEIQARCNVRQIFIDYEKKSAKPVIKDGKPDRLLIFGPHWHIVKWEKVGKKEGLRRMELAGVFAHELEHYKLHPSIFDSATGFLFGYIYEGSAYIPFAYKRLRLFKPLPATIYSYSRVTGDTTTRKELLRFDVIVMDEQGDVCVEVEEFTMMEVSDEVRGRIYQREHLSSEALPVKDSFTSTEELNERQRYLLRIGILPTEGVEVFRRLLAIPGGVPQVVVSTTDLPMRIARQKQSGMNRLKDEAQDQGPKHARPEISSAYVQPRNDMEKTIAGIFQENLGIAGIGINDDFFELGGDSLKAISVTGKIHKTTHNEVPLAEFFNYPTVKKLAQFIAGKETSEILEVIEPVEKKHYYILSPAQERLYVLFCLAPQNTGYNLSRGFELSGNVDKERIEEAVKKIIGRHECLRTSFVIIDGKPIQRVHEQVEFKLDYYDPAAQGSSKEEVVKGFVRPFDLEKAPLLRVGLIKAAEKKYVLVIDFHHIITDVHSMLVIFSKDFNAFYTGEALPPLQIQYKDFSEWQNRYRYSPAAKKHEEFWLEEFKNDVPVLDLPLDHVRPAVDSYQGDWIIFRLSAVETGTFRNMLQGEEATLFMGLLAVYNLLLFKLSGQEDIVVGTPTAGRNHPDLQPVMGMFVNMLVLRNFPHSEKTFSQFLKDVKERTLKAFAHQDYQFENLVEKLALERKPGRNPLFDVNLSLQSVAERSAQLTEEQGEFLDIETGASKFDLSLEIIEIGDFLHCKFEYKTQLFKRETIERFAAYFKEILAAVAKDKNIRLEDIRIIHDLLEPTAKAPEMEFKF